MDKKILSTAIAGVLAGSMAFAANADVTLYGQVDLSIDSVDVDIPAGAPAGTNGDDINMNSNASRIGIKGSEDLGGGLSAIFQLEYELDASGTDVNAGRDADPDAGGTFSGRDQWVGLDGFGKLRFGTMSTQYKSTGSLVDPMWDTAFDSRSTGLQSSLHSGDGANGEGRATNTVGYDTPDYAGFSAGATYSFDDECSVGTVGPCPDDDSYSLGGKYMNGPVVAFADYVTSNQGGADDAWKVGGSYSFGDAIAVYGSYEGDGGLIANGVPGDSTVAENEGADLWQLGGSYTMGNAMLYAAYGQGDDDDDVTFNTEYDVWTLAGKYNFSKRTMTYAGFSQIDSDGAGFGEADHFAVGMQHKF